MTLKNGMYTCFCIMRSPAYTQNGRAPYTSWVPQDPRHGPDGELDDLLQWVSDHCDHGNVKWHFYYGHLIRTDLSARVGQVTLATKKPAPISSKTVTDIIGPRVASGFFYEVWPTFCAYARMM